MRCRVDGLEPGDELGRREMFAGSDRAGSRVEARHDCGLVVHPQGATSGAGRRVHRPVVDVGRWSPRAVYHWPMYETTSYGGGALWVANETAIVACLDPRTGTIRASEHLPPSQFISGFEAIDPTSHKVFAFDYGALLQITPPRRCWH